MFAMKQAVIFFIALLLALLTVKSHAAQSESYLDAGFGFSQYDYKEEVPPPTKSTEKGLVASLGVAYHLPFASSFYFHPSFNLGFAGTAYDGTNMTGTQAIRSDTDNFFAAPEAIAGWTFLGYGTRSSLGIYTGMSIRYWRRDMKGPGGYLEDYNTVTFPLGLQYQQFFTQLFSITADISLRYMAGGTMKAHMGKFGMADLDLPLGSRLGARVSVPFTIWSVFGGNTSLVFTPWYEYFRIGEGDAKPGLTASGRYTGYDYHEPASTAHTYGTMASLRFGF